MKRERSFSKIALLSFLSLFSLVQAKLEILSPALQKAKKLELDKKAFQKGLKERENAPLWIKRFILRDFKLQKELGRLSLQEIRKARTSNNPSFLKFSNGKVQDIQIPGYKDKIEFVFHKREGSENLVVIAPGFATSQDLSVPSLWLFENSDILTIDFRGHGKDSLAKANKGLASSIFRRIDLDFKKTTFGLDEWVELSFITKHFKNKRSLAGNKYKNVIGYGLCFGAAMTLKAQALYKKESNLDEDSLFSHLILDGAWPSEEKLFYKFFKNPNLLISPQNGNGIWKKNLFNLPLVPFFIEKFSRYFLFNKSYKKAFKQSICKYAEKLKNTPVLFLHSKKDLLITEKEFFDLFNSVPSSEKIAIFTPEKHLMNILNQQPLLKTAFESFIKNGVFYTAKTLAGLNCKKDVSDEKAS